MFGSNADTDLVSMYSVNCGVSRSYEPTEQQNKSLPTKKSCEPSYAQLGITYITQLGSS